VTEATPQGIVDAINATSHGVSASIVDTGDASTPIRIVLTGELGADSSFTAATDISTGTSISFTSQISDAGDATFTLDGVDITRTSNMVDDLIAGATIELIGQSASTGVLQIAADTSVAEARIRDLVDSYNTVREVFKTLRDPDAADELAGSLSSDSLFRNIETAVREMVTSASSTPGDNLTYLSDIGVRMTREGTLEIDETDFTVALNSNYDDVVTMISADTDRQSMFGDLDRGIAGDAIAKIREFTNSAGSIKERTQLAQEKISNYEADLTALDKRMQAVSKRYLSQFTAMEQIVDRMNSTREYLKQQIESLPYSNRDS
jgi:flagellar hook-associated protein 2